MKVRIDERLEDAQMIKSWAEFLKAKKIIIANDEIEKMDLEKEIIRMSIDHIRVDFIQVEKLKDKLENEDNKESLIFVKKPEDLKSLEDDKISSIELGFMAFKEGFKLLSENCYVCPKDLKFFKKIMDKGVDIFMQDNPYSTKKNINYFI